MFYDKCDRQIYNSGVVINADTKRNASMLNLIR